jgi:RNA polymerase sigma-70 factor, ECF subfamily
MHTSEYITEDAYKDERDEEILARSVTSPDVFSVLLKRYEDAFLRKAEQIVRSREDAEDIVQEAFTKIYLNASKFKTVEGASFKSWGYKILMNTAFTRYQKLKRKRNGTVELDPEFYEMLPDTQSNERESRELSDYIVSVFARLPDHFVRVLRMHFIERMPQSEVAAAEGMSVGAVKTRIHRAKKAFREECINM